MTDAAEPCAPDCVSFATVVLALSRSPNAFAATKALDLYAAARDLGVRPDVGLVKSALAACVGVTGRKLALQVGDEDPGIRAARKVLADLRHLDRADRAEIAALAKPILLGTATEAWKSPPSRKDTFINNKDWNSFDSGFHFL